MNEGEDGMIEEYWEDGFVYYVTFISCYEQLSFTRAIVFNQPKKKEEIEKIVFNCFKNVLKIINIHEFDEILLLKEEFQKI